MYVNSRYAERELPILHEMIEGARFGLLVLSVDGPLAAHIPFVLRRDQGGRGTLVAHVARIDPLARHLGDGHEALAIFSGPREDRAGVIRGLRERGGDDALAVADAMADADDDLAVADAMADDPDALREPRGGR